MKIPLSKPDIDAREIEAVQEVLNSGWLTDGPKNIELEKNFASYIGVKRAVSLNSGTSALFLALKALGITGEVILPSFTFVASANAVVTAGATPVFADIQYGSCNIDPERIREKITRRTEAIMVVHYAGQSAEMDRISQLAEKYNLALIEDSAETIGGEFNEKKTGSFGIGCFSFFPTKNMTTGEGGMLTTNDDALADRVKALAGHGIIKSTMQREHDKEPWHREAFLAGYNFRLSNLLAALGVEQLKKLDRMNAQRRRHAAHLNKRLPDQWIDTPVEMPRCFHVYQMYTIKLKGIDRTMFIKSLRDEGIGVSVHFDPPVHLQEFYRAHYPCEDGDLPATENVAHSIVTLPMYPQMTKEELDYLIDTIKTVFHKMKGD
jgi:perosamine synthetase